MRQTTRKYIIVMIKGLPCKFRYPQGTCKWGRGFSTMFNIDDVY